MAKAFSVVSWNVQHFGATERNKRKPKKPIEPIIELIAEQNADIIAIYEVVGSVVFESFFQNMPDYQFHITEGPQSQEILVGVKKKFTSFFTQRLEFKSGQSTLRPGALLTLSLDDQLYPLLFLHLKSLTEPKGFGLRDDMTERALDFKKTLDKAANGQTNYIFLGDLNTMGMDLTYSEKDLNGNEEITRLRKRAAKKGMRLLDKTHEATWWPSKKSDLKPSDLDHVVAAEHLDFKLFDGQSVDVRGWPQKTTKAQRDAWRTKYSDHAILYFEVQK